MLQAAPAFANHGVCFERPHERGRAGEVHRTLCMSSARERERNEGRSHHAESVGEDLLWEE
jgi:hypothetical protein